MVTFLEVWDKFEVFAFFGRGTASRVSFKEFVKVIADMLWTFKVVDFDNR